MTTHRRWAAATALTTAILLSLSPAAQAQPAEPIETTSTPPGTSALPDRALTGYWHNFSNGSTVMRLSDVPASYDLVAVAFAEADPTTPGAVTFNVSSEVSDPLGGYTDEDFAQDVAALQANGQSVILSIGGELGNVIVNNPTSATNFANSLIDLIGQYGFDGVDIDLEHGIDPTHQEMALRQVSAAIGPDLIIAMAPQTLDMQSPAGAYFQLALNIQDILTVVNTQYYNSGTMLGCDGQVYAQGTVEFIAALACIQLENGLDPSQVALGLPATPRAAGGGYVNPSVVVAALTCLETGTGCGTFTPPNTYPGIRGAMTWSINWDATNGYQFANTVGGHLDS
ncbi:chitinase [Stackebrandtia endophytica]|uniref:chitinase n=1 Tax=Stackebrandtia endophytica TaxID=1496996 RepID=A0A543B162_9ACTN|nr:chitinase [Stackebrandtia endophytica]TQL78565.1 chitinase [Stackebrandtia endophytica]